MSNLKIKVAFSLSIVLIIVTVHDFISPFPLRHTNEIMALVIYKEPDVGIELNPAHCLHFDSGDCPKCPLWLGAANITVIFQ